MVDTKTIVIVVLALTVAVLGYLYYDRQHRGIVVNLPGLKIEAK
jgi:hypothetical protein